MEIKSGKLTLKSNTADAQAQEEMLAALHGASFQETYRLRFKNRYGQSDFCVRL
jgi:hypothetical protein